METIHRWFYGLSNENFGFVLSMTFLLDAVDAALTGGLVILWILCFAF